MTDFNFNFLSKKGELIELDVNLSKTYCIRGYITL
jgi:hypothetical protein